MTKRSPEAKRADALVRDFVFARDRWCRRCGSPRFLEWAHVVPGRHASVCWDPDASVVLCAACHRWQHANPAAGEELFRSLGIDVDAIRHRSMHGEPVDPRDVLERLYA